MQVEFDAFAGRTDITVQEIKTAGEITRRQTMEEFQKWRSNMELWHAGIRSHVETAKGDGKGKGGTEGKGDSRVDKKVIAVWKLPEDQDNESFRHWVDAVDQQLEALDPQFDVLINYGTLLQQSGARMWGCYAMTRCCR